MNKLESIVRRIGGNYTKNFSKEDRILLGSILYSRRNRKK